MCGTCIASHFTNVRSHVARVHAASRSEFGLPAKPPDTRDGIRCRLCGNECVIGEGELGFCGLRTVRNGRLRHLAGTPATGLLTWYRDPLPTNCVADWVCGGHRHPGRHNLAVFYESCTVDCLFCQNWHFRLVVPESSTTTSAAELAAAANEGTFCVCYFGGDPASQMPHALATSKLLAARGVRICWETAGTMHPKLLDAALRLSLRSGGCIKFDLKAFDEQLHLALCGISNKRTLTNFARAAARSRERPEPPLVVASTLLVPGYVDGDQVGKVAEFIASIDPDIPYSLLAFAPHFRMGDLPYTTAAHAREAEAAARAAGLRNVRIGNRHLLGLRRV
ncbi:MAG: radical SAM protein [Gemmatimonadales bacterium]|nr:radical SAM protein [Gemmatimonadales bacterium]NIN10352.1 radical SAM protein [Gemmatimonadales bacterium]NIN49147.1 radical SAM protein [Gemmatimonadales bacterium]NIP06611.1 radical SAM protein [Gemmatimonadales bacterium]NIS65433.1 radical SAM protein [Gemmatimonadales bacterium]